MRKSPARGEIPILILSFDNNKDKKRLNFKIRTTKKPTHLGVRIGLHAGSSCWVNLESGKEFHKWKTFNSDQT